MEEIFVFTFADEGTDCTRKLGTEGQKVRGDEPDHKRIIMASKSSASPDHDTGATGSPPSSPPSGGGVSAGSAASAQATGGGGAEGTDVNHSAAAPMVQDTPQHRVTAKKFDESLAKNLDKEQATSSEAASAAFEDRLRVSHLGDKHLPPLVRSSHFYRPRL